MAQTESFLHPYVDVEFVTGKLFEVQTMGEITASYKTEDHQQIEYKDVSHAKRGKTLQTIYSAVKVDEQMIGETLLDIDSNYTKKVSSALARAKDEIIIAGALGAYQSGENYGTRVDWSNVTSGATKNTFDLSGGALSLSACLDIGQFFMSKGYGIFAGNEVYLTVTEKQAIDLTREANAAKKEMYPVTFDQRTGLATRAGVVNFIIIPSSPETGTGILKVESSKRVGLAFIKGGIKLGISKDVSVKTYDIDDEVESYGIKTVARMDALRVTDAQVVKVLMQP
jgi:hypothetical protein